MLPGVGSDVQHSVKFIAFQLLTQIIPITLNQSHIGKLRLGIAVQDIHIVAFLSEVISNITADKNRATGYKDSSHHATPLKSVLLSKGRLKEPISIRFPSGSAI